jgi:ankyrin repeat protein
MSEFNQFGLLKACKDGDSLRALELIEKEVADYDELDENKSTPLMWAICKKMHKICTILLEKGKGHVEKVNTMGRTALMYACYEYKDEQIIGLLLAHPEVIVNNIDNCDEVFRTTLTYLLDNKLYSFVPTILAKGDCSLNCVIKSTQNNALLMASLSKKEDIALQIFDASLIGQTNQPTSSNQSAQPKQSSINLDHVNNNNETILLIACKLNQIKLADKILDSGIPCNPNQIDKYGLSALLYAMNNRMFEQVTKILELINNDSKIKTITPNKNTALILACSNNWEDIALKILQKPIIDSYYISLKDKCGKSAFDYVCINRNVKVATEIINKYKSFIDFSFLLTCVKYGFPELALQLIDKYLELKTVTDETELIKAKKNFNIKDSEGFDAIYYATNAKSDLSMFEDLCTKLRAVKDQFDSVIDHSEL